MILYLDTSALVKEFIRETHSAALRSVVASAQAVGVAVIVRPEFAAALAKGVRTGVIWPNVAVSALQRFRTRWLGLVRIPVTPEVAEAAEGLAWDYQLRGYDAVHLACVLQWQSQLLDPVTFITFDQQLRESAQRAGLQTWSPPI